MAVNLFFPETTAVSRRPSLTSSLPALPMYWWIGGAVIWTTIILIWGYCFYQFAFPPSEKACGFLEGAQEFVACSQDVSRVCIGSIGGERVRISPEDKDQKGVCKVTPGWPCPTEKDEECTDDAGCVMEDKDSPVEPSYVHLRDKGKFYCKAFPGATCLHDECYDLDVPRKTSCRYSKFAGTTICQVRVVEQESDPPVRSCWFDGRGYHHHDADVSGAFCKAKIGANCASPRNTAMQWCVEGSTCMREGAGWKCKATSASASIQLAETTDSWHAVNQHAANRSREMKSKNVRKKRRQSSAFLHVDLD